MPDLTREQIEALRESARMRLSAGADMVLALLDALDAKQMEHEDASDYIVTLKQQVTDARALADEFGAEVLAQRERTCGTCDSYEDPHYCLLWSIRPQPSHACADWTAKEDA
jgi:hypothetical protein